MELLPVALRFLEPLDSARTAEGTFTDSASTGITMTQSLQVKPHHKRFRYNRSHRLFRWGGGEFFADIHHYVCETSRDV